MVESVETQLNFNFDATLPNNGFVPSAKPSDAALATAGNAVITTDYSDVSAAGVRSAKSGGGGLANLLPVTEVTAAPFPAGK